jgi:hypothetical protein
VPQIRCELLPHAEIDDVPSDKANVLPLHVAVSRVGRSGGRGWFSAAALTDTARVWWSDDRARSLHRVVGRIGHMLTLPRSTVRTLRDGRDLAATALAIHGATITKAIGRA